ncbi:hypothetical protein ACFQ2B_32985 [Streptomyces stramineus]|uniref:Uncharacterized protein n=1 Tax=Streptomyces stramineus TaxID=173861 RepID=A0ABP3L128_9ACTN
MRRISVALAAAIAVSGWGGQAMAAPAAPENRPQVRAEEPPFPYADCLRAAKQQRKETHAQATWHCDQLVKKGWVTPPKKKPAKKRK